MIRLLLIFLLTVPNLTAFAQWPVYGTEYDWAYPNQIRETYDHGFIVSFDYKPNGMNYESNSGLLKVDVNGNLLWKKVLNNQNKFTAIKGISVTPDNGLLIAGWTCLLDEYTDPFMIKFNACLEVEWCNIYKTPGIEDLIDEVVYIPDDNAYLVDVFNDDPNHPQQRIFLMKLDSTGNIIWKNLYCTNTDYISELPLGLEFSSTDSSVILNGYVYACEDSTGIYAIKPYWMKVKTDGEFMWELYRITDSTFTNGFSRRKLMLDSGLIFSPLLGMQYSDSRLCKLSADGEFLELNTIYQPDSCVGSVINSSCKMGNSLYFGMQYFTTGVDALGNGVLQKTDFFGNFIKESLLPLDFTSIIFDICNTLDNKLLIGCVHDMYTDDFMLMKFTEDLEYDSIYTNPMVYDSLCLGGITSGSITMACNEIVKVNEPENIGSSIMKLTPNPAEDHTIIYLPELFGTVKEQGIFNVTSYRSDYVKDLLLSVFDINGRLVYLKPWPDNIKEQVLQLNGWKPGMYFIRISNKGSIFSTGKLLVR